MIAFFGLRVLCPVAAKMPPNAMAGPFPQSALMAVVCVQYGLIAAVFLTGGYRVRSLQELGPRLHAGGEWFVACLLG